MSALVTIAGAPVPHAPVAAAEQRAEAAALPPETRSALILKFGAVGDVLMAVPAAYELYKQGHRIDWVVGRAALPVLECYSWIHPHVIDEAALLRGGLVARLRVLAGLWRWLAGRRFDLVATLYYDARYRALALPVRAGRRVMLSETDRSRRLLPGRHHTDEFARILLGWPDEVRPVPLRPVRPDRLPASPLPRTPAAEGTVRPRVILAPAGARNLMADDALRRWPAASYVELARLLLTDPAVEVVLSGGPDDGWIQPLFAGLPVIDRIGQMSLPETLALYDEADLVITHDTGPLHLAGVTRASLFGLFGPTDPHTRLPQRPGATAWWGGSGFACRPCYDGHGYAPCPRNECLSDLPPASVFEMAKILVNMHRQGMMMPPRVTNLG